MSIASKKRRRRTRKMLPRVRIRALTVRVDEFTRAFEIFSRSIERSRRAVGLILTA